MEAFFKSGLRAFAIISLFCFSCHNHSLDKLGKTRAKQILIFSTVYNQVLKGNDFAVIFQKGFCGACNEESISKVNELLQEKKLAVFYRDDGLISPILDQFIIENKSICHPISIDKFDFYGLNIGQDIVFTLNKGGEISNWKYVGS